MKKVFAPGCALMIYKPDLKRKVLDFLNSELGNMQAMLLFIVFLALNQYI